MVGEVEQQVYRCIDQEESFIIEAGAGSGKTWTLVQALNYIISKKANEYRKANKRIACITYTRVAKEEIIDRIQGNELVEVKTIHDFLWGIIKPFHRELKDKLIAYLQDRIDKGNETLNSSKVKSVAYKKAEEAKIKNLERIEALGKLTDKIQYKENANYKKGIISHDVMLEIANQLIKQNKVLKKLIQDTYPVIFIDEYQDTKEDTAQVLLDQLKVDTNILFGLFGDYHQQIYEKSIGKIDPLLYGLKTIEKTENFRCSQEVINLLNKLRDDQLEQKQAGDSKNGKCLFYYVDDVNLDTEDFINHNLLSKFSISDPYNIKKLYLVTKAIAKKNNYLELHELYDEDDKATFKVGQIKQSFVHRLLPEARLKNKVAEEIYGMLSSELQNSLNNGTLSSNDESFLKEINEKVIKSKKFNALEIFENDVQELNRLELAFPIINRRLLERYFVDHLSIYGRAEGRREKKKDFILKNKDNRDCPFANFLFTIEEMVELYQQNKIQSLLSKTSFEISKLQDKINLNSLLNELIQKSAESKISEIFNFVIQNDLLEVPQKLKKYYEFEVLKDSFFYDLMNLEYAQFQRLYYTVKDSSPFSTNHGTKGAEFNNVVCFINDNDWKSSYSLDGYLSEVDKDQNQRYSKTKNLFYVICSRAKHNLAIVVLSKLSEESIHKAKLLFGEESFIYYNVLQDQLY
ncbi:RecBCD enzyme subunit RecB [Paenibacillus polymyxa]|uniref:AAA family ATPase n=1 Tax=Paenibacillus polymyxa TaxID=1406 RepID=A0AAP4E9C3_PAEPO|nr:UvrD-helicase domain-containing protein [Paenibacillus polymyxa]APQ58294.1 hypothetical protein VK72_05800 [Paenibacillus polymyxa]MDH2330348.1 AAA family ATPase [Paenibacillus polymyxa]VUG06599.1 RecBCD enzyme subunit RecB [Paenibacillus polymyxa]